MAHEPAMYRLTERDGILHVDAAPSGFALERRQAVGGGGAAASGSAASSAAAATTTSAAAATTTTTSAPAATTTQPATTTAATTTAAPSTTTTTTQSTTSQPETTTSAQATTTTTSAAETTTTTSSADSSTSTTSAARSTTTSAADTTVTRVITPTTVIVVGTSTFTSSLPPITSAETLSSSSQTALPASSGSGLSSGAIAGIAVGSAVGGIIALSLLGWLCLGAARRRRDKRDADNILWPATGDSSALYPEPVHNTGRAGFGVGDDGDDLDEGAGNGYGKQPGMSEVGAGAAGVGAAALGAGALGRYGSKREPQLPNVPPTVYTSEYGHDSYGADPYYGGGDSSPPEGASAYTGYSNQTPSQHSHSALAPGMGGMGYGGAAAAGAGGYDRQSPSPPRVGGASADGHLSAYDGESQGGHMPFPGEADHEGPERSLSPRPMQVGDTFGQGYDETEGGRRWRLSVVNDDPLDRD